MGVHTRLIQLFICSLLIVSQLPMTGVLPPYSILIILRQLNMLRTRFQIQNLKITEVLQKCSKRKLITRSIANASTSRSRTNNFSPLHLNQLKSILRGFSRHICRLNTRRKISISRILTLDKALPLTSLEIGNFMPEQQNKSCLSLVNQQT